MDSKVKLIYIELLDAYWLSPAQEEEEEFESKED